MQWYEPVEPRASLRHALACSWTAAPTGRHRLVPDACIDVLWLSTGDIWLCGPETSAWWFSLPPGVVGAGVRFLPGVAPSVLGLDASTVVDRRVRWRDVDGRDAEDRLREKLAVAPHDHRIDVWEDEIGTLLADWSGLDAVTAAVVDRLAVEPRVTARDLADGVGLTTRQLHRRSLVSFGYGVSTLARIMRFHRFWCASDVDDGSSSLAALASQAGYTDQAHLTRDCRTISGSTPRRFLQESFATFPDMSDPYKTRRPDPGMLAP